MVPVPVIRLQRRKHPDEYSKIHNETSDNDDSAYCNPWNGNGLRQD